MCQADIQAAADVTCQTGRALKRQLQRQRRKLFRAARNEQPSQASNCDQDSCASTRASDDESPARLALGAQVVRLCVRNTFFDVPDDTSSSDEDDVELLRAGSLPAPMFATSESFEEFRRSYRRFRLGGHDGAKGEASAPKSSCDWITLSPLEQSEPASSPEVEAQCSTACPVDMSACQPQSRCSELASTEEPALQTPARARKRQQQRERRRFFRAEKKLHEPSQCNQLPDDASCVLLS